MAIELIISTISAFILILLSLLLSPYSNKSKYRTVGYLILIFFQIISLLGWVLYALEIKK